MKVGTTVDRNPANNTLKYVFSFPSSTNENLKIGKPKVQTIETESIIITNTIKITIELSEELGPEIKNINNKPNIVPHILDIEYFLKLG